MNQIIEPVESRWLVGVRPARASTAGCGGNASPVIAAWLGTAAEAHGSLRRYVPNVQDRSISRCKCRAKGVGG
jgi:hypothetical protein